MTDQSAAVRSVVRCSTAAKCASATFHHSLTSAVPSTLTVRITAYCLHCHLVTPLGYFLNNCTDHLKIFLFYIVSFHNAARGVCGCSRPKHVLNSSLYG